MRRRAPLFQAILVKVGRILNKERYSLVIIHLLMNGDGCCVIISSIFPTNEVGVRPNLDMDKRQNQFIFMREKGLLWSVCGTGRSSSGG